MRTPRIGGVARRRGTAARITEEAAHRQMSMRRLIGFFRYRPKIRKVCRCRYFRNERRGKTERDSSIDDHFVKFRLSPT